MDEIQNLSKPTDFNNSTYYFKGKSAPKNFICFKGPFGFYKNIKEGYIILEKAGGKSKEFKSDINERLKGQKNQKSKKCNKKY